MLCPSFLTTFHVHLHIFISPNYCSHKVVKVINKFKSISVNLTKLIKENAKKESKARPITRPTEDTIFLVISNPSLYMIHYHLVFSNITPIIHLFLFFLLQTKKVILENSNFKVNIYINANVNYTFS